MAVTWKVESLERVGTEGSLSDVVKAIQWSAADSDGTYGGSRFGVVDLPAANASDFVAYASITESNAIAWAKAALGTEKVSSIETHIATQMTELKVPASTTGVPW